jgi:hypothetical protein
MAPSLTPDSLYIGKISPWYIRKVAIIVMLADGRMGEGEGWRQFRRQQKTGVFFTSSYSMTWSKN